MKIKFFKSPGDFRKWLEKNHAAIQELWVGYYSYENRSTELPPPYEKKLKRNKSPRDFFYAQPASYRKLAFWWVVSAKKEETRLKRLEKLIEESALGRRV